MINKGKNRQIKIDEKLSNPERTEEENRSARNKLLCLRLLVPSAGGSRSTMLLFGSFGKRNHQKPNHQEKVIGQQKSCWLFIRVILVEGT